MSAVRINMNVEVRVKLNERGRRLHHKDHLDTWEGMPLSARRVYRALAPDVDGYNKFQLWELMKIFGPGLYAGKDICFEQNEMLIDAEDLQASTLPEQQRHSGEDPQGDKP